MNIENLLNKINNNYLKNNKISLKKTFSFNNEKNNKFLIKNFEETRKKKILSLTLISNKTKIQCLNKNISLETQKNFENKNFNKIYKKFKLNKINNKFNEKLFINFNKNKIFNNFKLKNSNSTEIF